MSTPYHGAKSKTRAPYEFDPNRTVLFAGGILSGRITTLPAASRECSTCAVARSVLTNTLRFPIRPAHQFVEFFVVGEHRVVGQLVDQMQVHHRRLDRRVSKLMLQEHQRLYPICSAVAL